MKRVFMTLFFSLFSIFTFTTVSQAQEVKWQQALANLQVVHITSENTLSSDFTSKTVAVMCANGYFYMSVIDSISKAEFEGQWQVEDKPLSQPALLTVYFTDGDIVNYTLHYIDNKLYVDGEAFQYEYTNECG